MSRDESRCMGACFKGRAVLTVPSEWVQGVKYGHIPRDGHEGEALVWFPVVGKAFGCEEFPSEFGLSHRWRVLTEEEIATIEWSDHRIAPWQAYSTSIAFGVSNQPQAAEEIY